MFRRFNGWFARFMYGRYGSDQLNVVLLVLGLAISLAGSFSRLRDRDNRYFSCPKCRQMVRVPKGKGKINIRCPKCGEKFMKKT